MFLAEEFLLEEKSLGSFSQRLACSSPFLCHLLGFGLEMTERQPFLYHVFTAGLGAEGVLMLPTLASCSISISFLWKHNSPCWQHADSCQGVPRWPALSWHNEVCPPPLSSFSSLWFHPEIALTILIESSGWLPLSDAPCSTWGFADPPCTNRALHLPCLYLFKNSSWHMLRFFLHLILHTDIKNRTKCSDVQRKLCVIPLSSFILSVHPSPLTSFPTSL